MISIQYTLELDETFSPAQLIQRYAEENNLEQIRPCGFWTVGIIANGKEYNYSDHDIKAHKDKTKTVTIYLEERKENKDNDSK